MLYEDRPAPLEGAKITTATSWSETERRAIDEGDATAAEYMQKAADGIYEITKKFIEDGHFEPRVTLLCAKGNNSGDAYAAGCQLIDNDCNVTSLQFAKLEECSPLCQQHAKAFRNKGGVIVFGDDIDKFELSRKGVVLDGLFGTGFKGKIEGKMAKVIERVNSSHHAVISIDIPSGVSGDTGIVEGSAIFADLTIYLGLVKVGHLLNQGYEHVGRVARVDFGISRSYVKQLEPFAYIVNTKIAKRNVPHHKRTANKYSVGQVAVIAGSNKYPGAAQLACHAALATGAGLVRLYCEKGMEALLTSMAPEVIRSNFAIDEIKDEVKRIRAFLVGPGLGRDEKVKVDLEEAYKVGDCPVVIDADALFFFEKIDRSAVLTPHRGELCHLLQCDSKIDDVELLESAEKFAQDHKVTIVVKGAPTTIVSFEGPKIMIPFGNRGMASGGMGDALGGMIASLIAQGMPPRDAAVLGALLHALAGDRAAQIKSEQSMTASDLIDSISYLFQSNDD